MPCALLLLLLLVLFASEQVTTRFAAARSCQPIVLQAESTKTQAQVSTSVAFLCLLYCGDRTTRYLRACHCSRTSLARTQAMPMHLLLTHKHVLPYYSCLFSAVAVAALSGTFSKLTWCDSSALCCCVPGPPAACIACQAAESACANFSSSGALDVRTSPLLPAAAAAVESQSIWSACCSTSQRHVLPAQLLLPRVPSPAKVCVVLLSAGCSCCCS